MLDALIKEVASWPRYQHSVVCISIAFVPLAVLACAIFIGLVDNHLSVRSFARLLERKHARIGNNALGQSLAFGLLIVSGIVGAAALIAGPAHFALAMAALDRGLIQRLPVPARSSLWMGPASGLIAMRCSYLYLRHVYFTNDENGDRDNDTIATLRSKC